MATIYEERFDDGQRKPKRVPFDPRHACVLPTIEEIEHALNRSLLAECLGCRLDMVDEIVAVWSKRDG